jgi:Zn/Cd-binding protein ZinT
MTEKLITTLKEYKETYSSRLENHISKYEDYDELHFINNEIYVYQNCFSTANVSERRVVEYNGDYQDYKYCYLNEFDFDEINNEEPTGEENYTVKNLIKNKSKFLTDGYDLEICNQLTTSFLKIKSFLKSKLLELNQTKKRKYE